MITRETVIGDLTKEEQRVQYDDKDSDRLADVGEAFTVHMLEFLEALDKYINVLESPADEDSMMNMKEARINIVEKWAFAQAALSRSAWILRIDGQEAFARLCASLKVKSKPFIVSDL